MITIPEIEENGWTIDEFCLFLLRQLQYQMGFLREQIPNKGSIEIEDFQLAVAERIARMGNSFFRQVSESWDVEIVGATVRILADYVSGFYLIYGENNKDEQLLRHYLYIIDGFKHRLEDINVDIADDGRISHDEYIQLKNQLKRARSNFNSLICSSIDHIRALPIYLQHSEVVELLIKNANWKYKTLTANKKTINSSYSWREMYLKLGLMGAAHFSEFSCYVHGLSTCQLQVELNTFSHSMTAVVVVLISKLQKLLNKNFNITQEEQKLVLTKMIKNGELNNLLTNEYLKSVFEDLEK